MNSVELYRQIGNKGRYHQNHVVWQLPTEKTCWTVFFCKMKSFRKLRRIEGNQKTKQLCEGVRVKQEVAG